MGRIVDYFYRLFKFFISVKLAVIVIICLGVISAIGTIYEARYDTEYAQKIIYHSRWMYFLLGVMCIQLIGVMVDRWPWKKRHLSFLLAHLGIIITLVGSLVTRYWGVDGSMTFGIGEKSRRVTVGEKEVMVFASFDGQSISPFVSKPVDFLLYPPKENPVEFQLGPDVLQIVDYYHYALPQEVIEPSDNPLDGPAIRFQLQNDRVNVTRWLVLGRGQAKDETNLGPAQVILKKIEKNLELPSGNVIAFQFNPETKKTTFEIQSKKEEKKKLKGDLVEGLHLDTGWMGLQLRILRFIPQAQRKEFYEARKTPNRLTTSAIKMKFKGNEYWVRANGSTRLFTDNNVFILLYGNRRLDLGFELTLNDFRVGRYQGTSQAMSYESDVMIDNGDKATISMNNPLKFKGYTFYQASFQEDEMGKPVVSVLSVNRDPGRVLKYLGSFMVIFGAILLFYRVGLQKVSRRRQEGGSNL